LEQNIRRQQIIIRKSHNPHKIFAPSAKFLMGRDVVKRLRHDGAGHGPWLDAKLLQINYLGNNPGFKYQALHLGEIDISPAGW
jgi:hypothetical protein